MQSMPLGIGNRTALRARRPGPWPRAVTWFWEPRGNNSGGDLKWIRFWWKERTLQARLQESTVSGFLPAFECCYVFRTSCAYWALCFRWNSTRGEVLKRSAFSGLHFSQGGQYFDWSVLLRAIWDVHSYSRQAILVSLVSGIRLDNLMLNVLMHKSYNMASFRIWFSVEVLGIHPSERCEKQTSLRWGWAPAARGLHGDPLTVCVLPASWWGGGFLG